MESEALRLLYTIDERVRNLVDDLAEDRAAAKTREKAVDDDLESLKLSRAKVLGGAFALSFVSGYLQRVLWK